ncbi:hypothetical protein K432DRAFT_404619 [Lepidopterella palustris CBS 459.81]|uniref:Uncharacterized protein n=1 Tax=Lepidopterella palustris CBS 459.81 TaxID=1314670 RepID=A0A8E2EB15_9PEZI|nr:hypothetical protein K432DRAFT_404619 [Lepidopterella palustris CBS 459.81]
MKTTATSVKAEKTPGKTSPPFFSKSRPRQKTSSKDIDSLSTRATREELRRRVVKRLVYGLWGLARLALGLKRHRGRDRDSIYYSSAGATAASSTDDVDSRPGSLCTVNPHPKPRPKASDIVDLTIAKEPWTVGCQCQHQHLSPPFNVSDPPAKDQAKLSIEYFEGGKGGKGEGKVNSRPSATVRLRSPHIVKSTNPPETKHDKHTTAGSVTVPQAPPGVLTLNQIMKEIRERDAAEADAAGDAEEQRNTSRRSRGPGIVQAELVEGNSNNAGIRTSSKPTPSTSTLLLSPTAGTGLPEGLDPIGSAGSGISNFNSIDIDDSSRDSNRRRRRAKRTMRRQTLLS